MTNENEQSWEKRHAKGVSTPPLSLAAKTWLTPRASDGKGATSPTTVSRTIKRMGGPTNLPEMAIAVEKLQWPTPTVNGNYNRKGCSETSGDGLATVAKKFPTPQARDFRIGQASRWDNPMRSRNLNDCTLKFPTPTARDASNNNGPSMKNRNTPPLNAVAGGALNPTWVEWIMGWPLGWTDVDASVDMIWYGEKDWWSQERGLPRLCKGVGNRVGRLRCIGNGQVPVVAAMAWLVLNERMEK